MSATVFDASDISLALTGTETSDFTETSDLNLPGGSQFKREQMAI